MTSPECSQQTEKLTCKYLQFNNRECMAHMIESICIIFRHYINSISYYPNFSSVLNVNFICDVYTNVSLHRVCFPTMSNVTFQHLMNTILFFFCSVASKFGSRSINDVLVIRWCFYQVNMFGPNRMHIE